METLSPCDERTTTGTALQQGAMTTDDANAGEIDELWSLLADKDADLRHAAELGKMLLDEKEADAESHEAEKEALWRRIQEMARRVMELEQDAAEMRAISLQSHAAAAAAVNDDDNEKTFPAGLIDTPGHNKEWAGRGSFGSKRGSIGSGSERAEERVLRAKNEMLERQLEHMKEEAEETELELAAARKARFGRRSSCYGRRSTSRPPSSRASSSRTDHFRRSISAISPPPSTSSARRRESGTFGSGTYGGGGGASVDGCGGDGGGGGGGGGRGGGGGGVGRAHGSYSSRPGGAALGRRSVASGTSSLSRLSGWLASPRVSAEGVEEDDDEDDDVDVGDAGSETSEEALRIADRIHASGWTRGIGVEGVEDLAEEGEVVGDEGIVDEHDSAWLLEQNAWLMEELDSKDALIEALREQLQQQQQQQHRQSEQGGARYSYHERVGRASSDDGDDDDDEEGSDCPSFDGRERSFLDNLLDGDEGQTSEQLYRRYSSANTAIDEGEGEEEGGGEDVFEAADCEAGRVKCGAQRRSFGEVLAENALPGVENSSGTDGWKRAKSKSPVREGRENSLSPLRPDETQQSPGKRRSSVELKGLSRSPMATVRRLEDGRMAGAGAGVEKSGGGGAAAAADTATVATATAAPRVAKEAALETQGASLEESLVLSTAEEVAQPADAQEVPSAVATVALEPASVQPAALVPATLESVTQTSVAAALVIEASAVSPAVTAPAAEVPAGPVAPADAAVTPAAASGALAVESEVEVAAVVRPELAAERDAAIAADADREDMEKAEVVAVVAAVVAEVVAVATAAAEQKVLVAAAAKRKEEEVEEEEEEEAAAAVAAVTVKRKGEEAVAAAATQKEEEEVAAAATAAASAAAAAAAAVAAASKQEKAAAAATAVAAAAKRKREEIAAAAAAAAAEPPAAPQNRAERKSRQAVEKLGLRTVKGVFRMTMKTSNGVVFVVKRPDVFKHPQQETYVVFGTTETDRSGSEVRVPYSGAQTASAAATRVQEKGADKNTLTSTSTATSTATAMSTLPLAASSAATAAAASGVGAEGSPSRLRPDPSAVEIESVAAGVDPADTLTILSHAGCSTEVAIAALRRADGDVVDAAMSLTAV